MLHSNMQVGNAIKYRLRSCDPWSGPATITEIDRRNERVILNDRASLPLTAEIELVTTADTMLQPPGGFVSYEQWLSSRKAIDDNYEIVVGLHLDISGAELKEHCKRKVEEYKQKVERHEAAEKKFREDYDKDIEAGKFRLPPSMMMSCIGPHPITLLKHFETIVKYINTSVIYRISMTEAGELQLGPGY